MDIIWHGYSCFTIKTKDGTAVINPYQASIGLKLPALKANVVLVSADDPAYNNSQAVSGKPKVLSWPGEYEVAGIAITAQELVTEGKEKAKSMLFTLDADGLKVCYITDLSVPLSDELVEGIGEVDVLLLPLNGEKATSKDAYQAIEEIEPRAVIPMRYKTTGLKLEIEGLENFAKQAGIAGKEAKDKFSLNSKTDLPEDKTEFIVLAAQTA